jgi:hypothetical protein
VVLPVVPVVLAPLKAIVPDPTLPVLMAPVKPPRRPPLLAYVRMVGSQVSDPVKLPSETPGSPVISMAMLTTICWPMLGVALDGVAVDVTPLPCAVKLAVTVLLAFIVTEQAPVPEQAPPQELKT